jgi:hypothetical protein
MAIPDKETVAMTFQTQTIDTNALAASTKGAVASGFKTWTAAVLSALARRVERGAQARARRKAARMSAAELARLPEEVRMELGVNLPDAGQPSAFVQGLAGPVAYWAPGSGRVPRGDAKN